VDNDVARLVFTGLTRFDRGGDIVPDLARTFHVEQDGRVWTFEIREDARWHDGMPVVADDVVYTITLLQHPSYTGPFAEAFRGVSVQRVAPRVVRFTLPDPYGPFAGNTTVPLLPAHRLGSVPYPALAGDPFNMQPVGTGPFKVSDVSEREIALVANQDFYRNSPERSRPYLDRIILRFYRDPTEALMALARGELDGVGGIGSADAERARTLRTVSIYSYPTSDFGALFLNVRPERAVFRDRAVRQAIATAIDRGRVLQVAIDGRGTVADSFVPPTSWAYSKDIRKYPYSLEDAKALLDGAGWMDTDGDGVRDKGGTALRLSITTSDDAPRIGAGTEIVASLRAVGIEAQLRTVPFAELVERVIRPRAFDALLVGITSTPDPDPYAFFHSSQSRDPGFNFSGYSTLPMDRNLEAARRTFERERRRQLYDAVFQTIANDVPLVFLYFSDYLYAQHRQVKGLKIAAIVDPTQRFWDVEDWFVRTVPRR